MNRWETIGERQNSNKKSFREINQKLSPCRSCVTIFLINYFQSICLCLLILWSLIAQFSIIVAMLDVCLADSHHDSQLLHNRERTRLKRTKLHKHFSNARNKFLLILLSTDQKIFSSFSKITFSFDVSLMWLITNAIRHERHHASQAFKSS